MKVYLGTDHAGFEFKEKLKEHLIGKGYAVTDCGAYTFDKNDDYPDFISKVGKAISQDPDNSRGIIFGGSGQAEMMLANKYKNVRCALFYSPVTPLSTVDAAGRQSDNPYEIIKLTRLHNDANMLSLGTRFLKPEDIIEAVNLWLKTPFSSNERHIRRINKIKEIESKPDITSNK